MTPVDTFLEAQRGAVPQLRDMPVAIDHSLEGSAVAGGGVVTASRGIPRFAIAALMPERY